MNPDRQPAAASQSTAIPPTRATSVRSRRCWRISSRTNAMGGGLGRHVLQRDDVPVGDERRRLLQ